MVTRSRSHLSLPLVLGTLLVLGLATPAFASLADSAGIWETQAVEHDLVTASGTKASVDLGPARTAALGHLDSDGVVDLVVAYGDANEAFAVVTLGDHRFRLGAHHDRESQLAGLPPEAAFATEAVIYPLPFSPDWAAVLDADADGDFDVVFAARDRAELFWMAGDGQAQMRTGGFVELDGDVTAFTAADLNRRDGLDDLVIATNGQSGPELLVFESPRGALSSAPERLTMPGTVTSLAIDRVDDDGWKDISAAAGNTVVLVSGRDRKLVLGREKREAVLPATTTPFIFDSPVLDLAAGDFVGADRRAQLAVRLTGGDTKLIRRIEQVFVVEDLGTLPAEGRMISARSSGLPSHDLIVQRPSNGRVEIYHAESIKTTGRGLSKVPGPSALVSSMITGRLNLDTRDDLVLLREDGTVEIAASKSRVALVVTTTDDLDDGTCDATHCSLREAINTANALPAGSVITTDLGLGATIEPTSELPALTQPATTAIDGTVGAGFITGLLRIQGASAGTLSSGLIIEGGNAVVSHLQIGGFNSRGLVLTSGGNNTVTGCRLGVGGTGGDADPNSTGLRIASSSNNTIGGTTSIEANVISGNTIGAGITIGGDSSGNLFTGNLIGLNTSGDAALGNHNGFVGSDADGNQIGSTTPGGANFISGNSAKGIWINGWDDPFSAPWLILNNIIGLDQDGEQAIPNGEDGLWIDNARNLTIGGTTPSARNVVSGNTLDGIIVAQGALFAQILGNYIGTDATGLVAIGNRDGIVLQTAEELTVGGTATGAGNLISGNTSSGIDTPQNSFFSNIEILGNTIGPAADGSELGNSSGIKLKDGQYVTIGTVEAPNTISTNAFFGIHLQGTTTNVTIGPNSIYGNGSLGIDLGIDLVTPNDPLDPDTGPNGLQNFPEIEYVDQASGDVDFYVHSTPSTTYDVLFYESPSCDPSGYGEGKTYLGAMTVATEANGTVSDQVTLGPLTGGAVITATATVAAPYGNTSEFSMCFDIPYPAGHIFSDGFESGGTDQWTAAAGQ